jgi:hypothetical protein
MHMRTSTTRKRHRRALRAGGVVPEPLSCSSSAGEPPRLAFFDASRCRARALRLGIPPNLVGEWLVPQSIFSRQCNHHV